MGEGDEGASQTKPWHVPVVPEGGTGELPPAVAEAARRALSARRPGVSVAPLVEERRDRTDGSCLYRFSDGSLLVELRVARVEDGWTLGITCPRCRGGAAEVMHGGETHELPLDEHGAVQRVPVQGPLLGVVVHPPGGSAAPTQTSWVRVR